MGPPGRNSVRPGDPQMPMLWVLLVVFHFASCLLLSCAKGRHKKATLLLWRTIYLNKMKVA